MKKFSFVILSVLILAGCSGSTNNGNGNENGDNGNDVVPDVANLSCSEGYMKYESPDTPIKFCYLPAWGDVVTEEFPGSTGKKTKISFSEVPEGPQIIYITDDYTAPEGETEVDFSGLNIYTTDDKMLPEVSELLGIAEENLKVRKNAISVDNRAVRVRIQTDAIDELRYYVPEAFEGHRILLKTGGDMAAELDDMAFDILF